MHALQRFALRLTYCLVALVGAGPACGDEHLDAQRAAFVEAHAEAELGIWNLSPDRETLLRDYILWPDLRATWLRSQLGDVPDSDVTAFLAGHGDLKPARELRYRFALSLARRGRSAEFLALYDRHYADLGVERLDCLALKHRLGDDVPDRLPSRARELWLVGASQVSECDPLFDRFTDAGLIDEALHRERYALAVEARELGMARYLARSLPADYKQDATRWTAAYGRPAAFLDGRDPGETSARYRAQLIAATERLAYDEPVSAANYWREIREDYPFTPAERAQAERHVALWLARTHHADAEAALRSLPGPAIDDEVRRWRVRDALRRHDWRAALEYVEELSAGDRASPQWRYWRALLLRETSRAGAREMFEELATERSYYGFLAADALGADYAFSHRPLPADDNAIDRLAAMPELRRARELFMVGLDGRGRSEWDATMRRLSRDEQVQAAVLAHRWGWHSRAIATAADTGRYDDLELRYPLPWAELFRSQSKAARLNTAWALGVARSESLFMPDIRSSAGAIGLMQLTPSAARVAARDLKLPWRGRLTLTNPEENIRLGVSFLGNMHERFFSNPVLATAAYNAGPLRVEDWLPAGGSLDARVWIETIPYSETRDYVRRVLTAATIFAWRLGEEPARLSAQLQDVPPAATLAKLAGD